MDELNIQMIRSIVSILKIAEITEHSKSARLRKRKRRIWSREWLLRRDSKNFGICSFVQNELLEEDINSYRNFLRMNHENFEKLHDIIKDDIKKNDTSFRCSISSRSRLMITLRFLATGETFKSLSYSSRIAACTISKFVPEVLSAIYEKLVNIYLKTPSSPGEWKSIANDFFKEWNVPNTIGAMDGKHIVFRAPRSAGSHYYNYKGNHSIVLLAIVDAHYKFVYIDVGTNGRVSDGGVYEECDFQTELNRNTLNLPQDQPLCGSQIAIPYVILADAAFPLQEHILKPYPLKNMTREQRIYNYRLSRGRRVVENAFGILANRFRVLLNPINLSRDKVVLITQACCVLHNFIKTESPDLILQEVDDEDGGNVGSWRSDMGGEQLQNIVYRTRRPTNRSLVIREEFKNYFNGRGSVPWQDNKI